MYFLFMACYKAWIRQGLGEWSFIQSVYAFIIFINFEKTISREETQSHRNGETHNHMRMRNISKLTAL